MYRCKNWDYKKPYYYFVTLKCVTNAVSLALLSDNDSWGFDPRYELTQRLRETLLAFCERTPSVESVTPYAIMPDHIHLLLKIANIDERKSLPDLVDLLMRLLRNEYQRFVGEKIPLFEKGWYDLIVKKPGQLKHFRDYIVNNPKMALLRRQHRDKFHCYRSYRNWRLGDRTCDIVGNPELLDEPAFLAVRLSRSILQGSSEWQRVAALYEGWRGGATAVGTWWSPAEKMVYRKIIERGGNVILLAPHGFHDRWHPAGEEAQRLCAEGRLLFVSPYAPQSAKLAPGETRRRCLELNALALEMGAR